MVSALVPKRTNRAATWVTFGLRSFSPMAIQMLRGFCSVISWNYRAETRQITPFGTRLGTSEKLCAISRSASAMLVEAARCPDNGAVLDQPGEGWGMDGAGLQLRQPHDAVAFEEMAGSIFLAR
jgi:hypothetical protein